ncbi:hypothetical protein [Ruminococcus sp.]|uniref:hypothetical protein n=1 Tax=Ruminococcus sp. TaxID=41978 RepID=UPI00388EB1D7
MKRFSRFIAMIAFLLTICIFVSSYPCQMVSAVVGQDLQLSKLYLKEVKMFYGESPEEAQEACEKEGFTFCPTDINEGAPKTVLPTEQPGDNNGYTNPFRSVSVHMGYKTTEDPEEAITDLTLLDMNKTHYTELDYKKYLNEHLSDYTDQAAKMMVLVDEFENKKNAGSPNALLVYDALNLIYVDENKPHDAPDNQLGNYLINKADKTFFEKFMQRGNAKVLNRITDLLCNAAADYNTDGETWVDRSKTSEVAYEYANGTSDVKNMYDQNCEDPAKQLIKAIKSFSTTYSEAKQRFDEYGETLGYPELEGMTQENASEKLAAAGPNCRFPEYSDALKTYALLDSVKYQTAGETVESKAGLLAEPEGGQEATQANGGASGSNAADTEPVKSVTITYSSDMTLAQYIMNLASDPALEDHASTVYPIVSALTPAQRSALSLGGLSAIVEELFQAKDYASKGTQATNEAIKKLKDIGFTDGRLYLWSGTDNSIYEKKVVQTSAANEAKASGKDLEESISAAARKNDTTLQQALDIVDQVTTAFSGVMTIVGAALSSSLWSIGTQLFECAGMFIAAEMAGMATLTVIGGVVLCALQILNIIANVVSFLLLVFNILVWCGAFDEPKEVDFSQIPDVVMDARQAEKGMYSVRYDSVQSNAEEYKELCKSKHPNSWVRLGLYLGEGMSNAHAEINAFGATRDRWVAMFYSKAPAAGEPIEIKPDQELFVTRSDYKAPQGYRPLSLIVGTTAEDVNSVTYANKEVGTPLYVYFPGEAAQRETGGVISDDGRYVTGACLSYSDNKEDAINRLKASDFEYIDANLTPYQGFTYLGYKLGGEENALTDIRLSNSPASKLVFGDASYAKAGADKDNTGSTPDGMALFVTSSPAAGSPIMGLTIENKRKESGSGMEPVCLFSGGDAVDISKKWQDNILECGEDSNYEYFLEQGGWTSYKTSSKAYSYEFISQDDPSNGSYIYYQPKEQFKAKDEDGNPAQRYIAGFSYFLAGDKETDKENNKYGSNYEYMQTFAKENGFELLMDGGEPLRVMSDEAGEMTMGTTWRDVGGYPADTYNFDQFHTLYGNQVFANGDGGLAYGFMGGVAQYVQKNLVRREKRLIFHTAMYFGVSYTYNPHRAITGVSGLLTPYTETTKQIKYEGMKTPAGTLLPCNVSMQGCPMMSAGITAGYYSPSTMSFPLYTNYEARQRSDLSWMNDEENEILSRYLMTAGPREAILPLKEGDIAFNTSEKPGEMDGFVPICDLRSPGDYEHPLNFALDTTNKGSKYLYLYLKNSAGGRKGERTYTNVYSAKKYVAAVVCGVGRNPEAAISNLYANAADMWKDVAKLNKDVSVNPTVTEFDEIIPVDLSSEHPWYELHCNDTNVKSLKNGEWVRGNELAYYRWEGHNKAEKKSIDEYEKDFNCAYVGVIRTANKAKAAYGVLKYYSDAESGPATLNSGSTKCIRAGGPVKSKEGNYFLYYSTNSGTAAYQAPITGIEISDEIFINGYNTVFTVNESDRVDNQLPQYGQLRMRTDEYKYIHLGYERKDLPYYEKLYLGVGKTKEEAFADMVGTTNAYAAMDVNCNYNSFSDQWIAVGYRRTSSQSGAIRDVFLYQGDNPPDMIVAPGAYMKGKDDQGNTTYVNYKDKKGDGVTYRLLKHNLKSGSEVLSLNKGNGGPGLYLYYTTSKFYSDKSAESLVTPITNMCFAYGDISPRFATTEQLANVFERSYYAKKAFDASDYQKPVWECVLGVSGSPTNWKVSGEGASRLSLNSGVRPGLDGNGWNGSDNRVYMYVDRSDKGTAYMPRKNAKLPEFGYYSPESIFGMLKQAG